MAYDEAETVGYAAARLPACYAVAWRVFDELELRLPDFQPKSLLDFGAGPGTAIWAALDVSNLDCCCPWTSRFCSIHSALGPQGVLVVTKRTATSASLPPHRLLWS